MKRVLAIILTAGVVSGLAFAQNSASSSAMASRNADAQKNGDTSSAIEAQIRKAWQDFKNKNKAEFAKMLWDDCIEVESDGKGPRGKNAVLSEVDDWNLKGYSLTDFQVKQLGPRAVLATYSVSGELLQNGQSAPFKLSIGEVWEKRGGEWKLLYYPDTPRN